MKNLFDLKVWLAGDWSRPVGMHGPLQIFHIVACPYYSSAPTPLPGIIIALALRRLTINFHTEHHGKSELDSHFGNITRYIRESGKQWQEDMIVEQVVDVIRDGAKSVDIIPIPVHSVDPISECTKIIFPGLGCVHTVAMKGSVFYVEGKVYRKKIAPAKNSTVSEKRRIQKPDTRKRVLAVQKKFKNLEAVKRRGSKW